MSRQVLQLCHDYQGPFVSVCRQYVEAFPDAKVTTVFIQGDASARVQQEVGGERVQFLEKDGENLRGFKFAQIRRLHKLLADTDFDVVVAHRYKAIYLAGILSYFKKFRVLLGVVHEHNVLNRVTRKLFVTFWRKQIVLAGVSDSVVDDIARRCPHLAEQERLFCLPNVLSSEFSGHMRDRIQARAELNLSESDFVVGTIGRLVQKKSLPTLLKAFAIGDKDGLQGRLVIVGDGPVRAELEALAVDLGVATKILFVGHLANAGYFASLFDVFVLASGEDEAFGIVLLEAMMAKVPVITSAAKGPAAVVAQPQWQFKIGDEVDLADKLMQLKNLAVTSRKALVDSNYQRVMDEFSASSFRKKLVVITG